MTTHERLEPSVVKQITQENERIVGDRHVTPKLILKDPNLRRMNIVATHIEEVHGRGPLGSEWAQLVAQHTKAIQDGEIDLEDLI